MSYWRLYYHLVWATKDRRPALDARFTDIFRRSTQAYCTRERVIVHALGGVSDHVHLTVSIPPRISVAQFVRDVKGTSARIINIESGNESSFYWQPEYGVVSFGEASLDRVVRYVADQKQHHTNGTLWQMLEIIERPFASAPSPGGAS